MIPDTDQDLYPRARTLPAAFDESVGPIGEVLLPLPRPVLVSRDVLASDGLPCSINNVRAMVRFEPATASDQLEMRTIPELADVDMHTGQALSGRAGPYTVVATSVSDTAEVSYVNKINLSFPLQPHCFAKQPWDPMHDPVFAALSRDVDQWLSLLDQWLFAVHRNAGTVQAMSRLALLARVDDNGRVFEGKAQGWMKAHIMDGLMDKLLDRQPLTPSAFWSMREPLDAMEGPPSPYLLLDAAREAWVLTDDSRLVVMEAGAAMEMVTSEWLDSEGRSPEKKTLGMQLKELRDAGVQLPGDISYSQLDQILSLRNDAVHNRSVDLTDALSMLKTVRQVVEATFPLVDEEFEIPSVQISAEHVPGCACTPRQTVL